MDIILYLLTIIQYLYQMNCWLLNFICRYIPLKQWAFDDSHSPKYQKYKIDELPLITDFRQDWTYKELISHFEKRYKKKIRPIKRRSECDIPDDCSCPRCQAPKQYLYKNNGCKGQLSCKICDAKFSQQDNRFSTIKLRCPHCGNTLVPKKDRKFFVLHKCVNPKCPYYLHNLKKVEPEHLNEAYGKNKYKLHYIYREFTVDFFRMDLNSLPKNASSLKFSRHNAHVMGLCLIVIQKGMSESQTMKTALHEVAGHARMHDRDLMKANGIEKDQMTKEVEAESVAFACAAYYNLDTSDYSFPYIAGWSSGKDMKELKASMDEIRQAAGSFIDEMDEQIQILVAERDQKKLTGNLEDQLLNSGESRYGIYQIKDGSGGERYEFMGMDFVKEQNLQVVGAHYELVYSGVLTANDSLDSIYEKFNINHPEDFTGHSLSVSDIVVLAGADGVTAHYVDSFGFADVPQFVEQRRNMVAATQKDQEMTFDKQAEKLASDIDAYSFDFDQHGYQDAVENREAAVDDLKKDILSGNTDGVTKWLQEIVDEADMNLPEDVSKAQELITRLEQAKQIREQDQTMVKDVAITFYVAECMEFPVMGEYHEGLTLPL